MKRTIIGVVLGGILMLVFQYYRNENQQEKEILKQSQTIEQEIKNVGKLVVSEGYFSDVITYQDARSYLGDLITFDKKALIIVNTEATIAYDLHQIKYKIDKERKRVILLNIPEKELKIYPKMEYYSLSESQFNPFTAEDHNKINKRVHELFQQKIKGSSFEKNAENRLITELSKLLILTSSMGWILEYNAQRLQQENDWQELIKG